MALKFIDLHIMSFQKWNIGDKVTGDKVTGGQNDRGQIDRGQSDRGIDKVIRVQSDQGTK
jgi:hypothetical protein